MVCYNLFSPFSRSPLLGVLLYVFGMLLIIAGTGCMIISIDPRPLPRSTWKTFFTVGVVFIAGGLSLLVLVVKMKPYPGRFLQTVQSPSVTICSAANLINESLFEENGEYSPIAYTNVKDSLESVRTVSQCMMTKPTVSTSNAILFYKETFV